MIGCGILIIIEGCKNLFDFEGGRIGCGTLIIIEGCKNLFEFEGGSPQQKIRKWERGEKVVTHSLTKKSLLKGDDAPKNVTPLFENLVPLSLPPVSRICTNP